MRIIRGFSLLELMLSIAIVAMLVSIAYPVYHQHLVRMRRQHAKTALMQLAGRLEQYYSLEGQYRKATPKVLGIKKIEQDLDYKLELNNLGFDHFKISAMPLASQAKNDAKCGTLSITETGRHDISGYGEVKACW
ncbi:MAG: type IV pilin protein [Gammaproteobacteria bacterium]|nr:type IV pilin protein [Gammaproteobacteria bacterium]